MKYFPISLKPTVSFLLIIFIIVNISIPIFKTINKYTSRDIWQRYPALKFAYEDSQYANKHPKGWISDEPVNTYAGAAYVKGVSPILIAADTPPLGRYLIGLSSLVFNNENIITLISGIGALIFMYLVGTQIYNSRLMALIPPALLSIEPLFKNQFVYTPLLDIMQLMFLLSFFYFFNIGLCRKKHYLRFFIICNFLIGCFISTKFFMSGITLIAAAIVVLLYNFDKKKIAFYILTLPIAVIVLLGSYSRVLFDNPNIIKFVGIQKWVYMYHKSQLIYPFSVWPLIFFNKWYVWWGNKRVISEEQWMITWPIITTASLFTSFYYFLRKTPKKKEIEILFVWVIFYLMFSSIGQITARYLVILLPVMYLITIFGFKLVSLWAFKNLKKSR